MRITKDSFLLNKPIAHRGLWGNGVTENSLSAYEKAADLGYPIEIDLYLSADGELFSFHDRTLERMTGEKGFIYDKTAAELKNLRLKGTNETIPTFDEVLNITEGKIPLLVEIKNQPNKSVVDKTVARLKNYRGEFAVQSFNPFYIARVKKLAPEFIRGILATDDENDLKNENPVTRFVIKNMPFNGFIKPDFISYHYSGVPLPRKKTKDKAVLCWTVTSQKIYDDIKPFCDNIIFENFIPERK